MLITPEELLMRFPDIRNISEVLHIGGHAGEERPFYLSLEPRRIIWVEANHKLVKRWPEFKPVHGIDEEVISAAIWSHSGQDMTLHVTDNGQSSSLLPMGTHAKHYPDIAVVRKQKLKTKTIDEIAAMRWMFGSDVFLNLDIQGAEWEALIGGIELLRSSVKFVYTEVNTEQVYEGCKQLPHIDMLLEAVGFSRHITQMTEQGWGDAFYVKDGHVKKAKK